MRQTNTRKKNNLRSMIIVALLLLLVAVIGFGGYTLSKYVSNKTEGGTAQVAKWGYTVEADATNLFGKNYKFDAGKSNSIIASAGDTSLTVSASTATDNNLVAPGTTGSMTFSVKGTAEVLAKVSIEVTGVKDIVLNYEKDGTDGTYKPVKWTLTKKNADGTTTLVDGKTLAEVATELEKAAHNPTCDPNSTVSDEYTLSWAWAFEDTTKAENNDLDTLLGMLANDKTVTANGEYKVKADTCTDIEFTLKISVTQLAKNA